jgi:hypothetical protein
LWVYGCLATTKLTTNEVTYSLKMCEKNYTLSAGFHM